MTKIDKKLLDGWKPYLDKYNLSEKDVKSHIEEYYPNGQVKMIIHYVGDWDTGNHSMLGHSDYDEDGNLMKFDSSDDRFNWLSEMKSRSIDMQGKDYSPR